MSTARINIHAVIPRSRVNGPGARLVVFFQGCERNCPGCFNPRTHDTAGRRLMTAAEIFDGFPSDGIEGITVSGGEPFLQPGGLFDLLTLARARGLTTVVYTGFELDDLEARPGARACLGLVDVLIDGAYDARLKEATALARGSTNQKFHLFSNRYSESDFVMPGRVEVFIGPGGDVVETGFGRV